jgi:hypothetical protein
MFAGECTTCADLHVVFGNTNRYTSSGLRKTGFSRCPSKLPKCSALSNVLRLGKRAMPLSDVDRDGRIEQELLTQLDRTIAEYRLATIASDNSASSDRERVAFEKNLARQDYDAALARYNDFVISGIIPSHLIGQRRVLAAT